MLTWHEKNKSKYDFLCHPYDSSAWKVVDDLRPEFANE